MSDIQANIGINLDTANAMAQIRALQREIANFQTAMARGSAQTQANAANLQQNLINKINKTGQFSAQMTSIKTTTESFTNALERNKLSMGQYFRYAGASTKTFGRLFRSEFETINKVARERVKTLQTQYVKMGRDASGAMKAIAVRPLALDMDNLATKTMIAAQRQQLFNQLLRQGSTNLLNFGKNTQWAGRQLMVGFTIPLAIFGSAAAREFMKLEEQAIRFKRVYGDMFTTSGQTEKALNNIKELAQEFTKYGIAVEETVGLAAKLAQMGNMGDALEAQVRQSTRLSVLGGIDQQEALDTTISLTNAFGVATEDLADSINFLNAAENQTILSIEDFNEAIPKAGSVVKTLGGDVQDLAFFLTAMREGGINASQGANALKSSLGRLINPTEAARKRLSEMGIDVVGIVEANAGNLRGTVMALGHALEALDPLTRARAIEQLFGKFQFARMSTMFSNIVKEGSQANKVLQLTTSTTQELGVLAERELGRVEDSVAYKFKKSLEEFQVAMAPLGEAFLKAVLPLVEFGTKILDKFNEMSDGAKQFAVITAAVLGLIGPVALMTFGLLANGVANVIKMFANLSLGYQRVTGQNQALGLSTQYMTQEQLEASAVAASLQQSHATLVQTFTTETGALNNLAAAYTRAVAAQRPFIGAAGKLGYKPGPAPKGYASGVVSVPGRKGDGDVVPAMLSPGEAVIPRKMAEKYSGLISAMISDKIPGFEDGLVPVNKAPKVTDFAVGERRSYRGAGNASLDPMTGQQTRVPAHAAALYGQGAASMQMERVNAERSGIQAALGRLSKTGVNFTQQQVANMMQIQREHLIAPTIANGQPVKSFEAGAWRPGTGASNILITQGLQKSKAARDMLQQELKSLNVEQKEIKSIMDKSRQGVGLSERQLSIQGKALTSIGARYMEDPKSFRGSQARFAQSAYVAGAGLEQRSAVVGKQLSSDKQTARLASVTTDQQKRALERQEKYAKQMSDRVEKRQRGALATEVKAAKTREQTAAAREKVASSEAKSVTRQTSAKSAAPFKPSPTALAMLSPKQIESLRASGKNPNRVAAQLAKTKITARTREVLGDRGVRDALAAGKNPNNVAAGRAGSQALAANRAAAAANPQAPGPTAGSQAGEAAARSKLGLGSVAALAGVGAIGASFAPGKIGEVAQQLILPLMMLPMILPLLKNPIVLAVAAVAALGVGIFMLYKGFKDATRAGLETSEAMSMTAEKIKAISEVTGTVSATESRRLAQAEQLTAVGPEFTSFGLSFIEDSEPGKAMMEDIEKQVKSGRSMNEIANNMARQLSIAMSQGVLNIDQARSIAAAIGTEIGDYGVSMQISGRLTELVGVDGSDLLKDPLEIALRIKEDSMKEQSMAFGQSMSAIMENRKTNPLAASLLGLAATSATVGAVSAAGAVATGGTSLVPAMIAGGISLAATGGAAYVNYLDRKEDKELASAAVGLGIEQLSLNEQMLDSVNARYDTLVAEAETQEQIAEIERRRREDIGKLNEANAETTRAILDQARSFGDIGMYQDAINASIDAMYKEGPMKVFADEAKKELSSLGVKDQDFKMSLELMMATGEMNPITVLGILETASKNPDFGVSFKTAVEGKGVAQISQLFTLLTQNGLEGNRLSVLFDFVANKNEPEFSQSMEALAVISSIESRYLIEFDLETNGEEILNNAANVVAKYQDLPDKITKEAFIETAAGDANLQTILNNWETLGLTGDISRQFVIDFVTSMNNASPELVAEYMARNGISSRRTSGFVRRGSSTRGTNPNIATQQEVEMYGEAAILDQFKLRAPATTPYNDPEEEEVFDDKSGGGGTPSSVLDNLLKKLRDVQDATIKVAKGWDAARQSLDRLFAGGETMALFGGLEQRMRRMNLGQNLIELIVGMDPDEFEKRKGELFTFDGAGNITGITTALRNMQLAMNSIALGDFQNKQQETLTTYRDQVVAIDKLVRSGVSLSVAYKAVEDTAFAAAVAQEKSNGKIREAAKDAERAAKATRDFAAAQAVVGGLEQTASQREIADWLIKNRSRLTNAQVEAIVKDTNLQRLILDPTIDPRAVNQALQDAANQADLDLKIKKFSIEGLTSIFDEGFSRAMERFSAREEQITLDFALRTSDDEGIIEAANREISTIRYQLDDLEADLKRIQDEEDKINNYYDDRIDALDEVANINERLSRQQKSQLSIADALSQGDIAAAARARQEYIQQQSQDAIAQRKERLEDSREQSLSQIRLANGQSRVAIEKQIRDLSKEIFDIEEERLEPAQRRVELANQEMKDQIDALTVLGKTREEWARIQNNIDIARTNSDSYTKSIQNALDVVGDILEYWNELDGKQVTTYHQIVETRVSTPSPPPASPAPPSGGGGGGGSPTLTPGSSERDNALAQLRGYEASLSQAQKAMESWNRKINLELLPRRNQIMTMPNNRTRAIMIADIDKEIASARSQVSVNAQEYNAIKAQISALKKKWGFAMGGVVPRKNLGGLMSMALGGMFQSVNTDSIPAMLTAGEYVVKRSAVQKFGLDNLEKINSGTYSDGSVYNYNLAVNVKSDADPNKIARVVMSQIKQIDAQRIRGNRI
jgi:TP901 family phage tail tape measure protein